MFISMMSFLAPGTSSESQIAFNYCVMSIAVSFISFNLKQFLGLPWIVMTQTSLNILGHLFYRLEWMKFMH